MLVRILFLCVLILLSSCKSDKNPHFDCPDIDVTSHIDISFEDLISSTDLVPLENTPESILPIEGRIWPSENGFFYNGQTPDVREVFYFNDSGGFENNIGKVGKGPGEFPSCNNLIVLGDTIAIYDNRKRISYYLRDGSFIGKNDLEDWAITAATVHPSKKDVYLSNAYGDHLIYRLNRYSMAAVDSFIPNNVEATQRQIKGNSFYPLGGGRLFFQDRLDPRLFIFEITDTLEPRYHIETKMKLRRYRSDDPQKYHFFTNHRIPEWSLRGILENKDWLYLFFRTSDPKDPLGRDFSHYIIRRKDNVVYRLPGHRNDKDYFERAFRLDPSNLLYLTIIPDHMYEKDTWMEICRQQNIPFSLDQNTYVVKIDLDHLIPVL